MAAETDDSTTSRAARRWTVADVIDFEVLAAREVPAGVADDARRQVRAAVDAGDRDGAFLSWLRVVRPRAPGVLPGAIFTSGVRGAGGVAAVTGFLLGIALAGALLAHGDAEPINALLFLGTTVGLQVGLLVLVAAIWALKAAGARLALLQDALLLLIGVLGRIASRLDGRRRTQARAAWAEFDMRSTRLAPLIGCELLVVTQFFAVAFNLGLLAAMLLVHLPFEELRFGWQSTYSFTADGVAGWVRAIARPWLWISDVLAPTAAQIEASRYTRGQAAATLPAGPARAWWPFLMGAIVFYGLGIRALLIVVARLVLRRRLGRLRFTDAAANALWRSLEGPLFRAAGNADTLPDPEGRAGSGSTAAFDLFVVDREMAARRVELERALRAPPGHVAEADIDDDALPSDLAAALERGVAHIGIAVPAGRDPIVAIAGFLAAVSRRAGPASMVMVVLVPDTAPAGDASPGEERRVVWTRFLAIHRLSIAVETLR